MSYLYLILGLAFLVVGGEFLVKGSVSLALKFKISTLVIGLTVVAFATSAPELLVSLQASLNGHSDIALGNVIGSNIANIGLIMGLTAFIFTLPVSKLDYRLDYWFLLGITLLLFGLLKQNGQLGFIAGAIFVTILIGYNYYKIWSSRKQNIKVSDLDVDTNSATDSIWKVLGFLLIGIIGLRFGAQFFVEGAAGIALEFGVSERVISVTVVAFGTSVPELVASIIAARKNEQDLAVGNLIGSNIFNILAVLGFTSLITPIEVSDYNLLTFDYWWMLAITILIFPLMGLITKGKLGRIEGLFLFLIYVTYIFLALV